MLGLYGGQDKSISAKDVEDMRAAIKANSRRVEIIVYPDAQHGFLADYRPSFNAEATKDGWAKMLACSAAIWMKSALSRPICSFPYEVVNKVSVASAPPWRGRPAG